MPSSIHQAKRPYAGTHSQSHHNQSSITSYFPSTSSSPPTPPPIRHKRRLSSSDSDDDVPFSILAAEQHDGLSPKSQPRQAWDDRVETRTLAQPRRRRTKIGPFQASGGRESADFENAEFLDYQALEGGEVVMRDV